MQEQNPYSTPGANLSGRDSFATQHVVTQGVVEQLAKTKGWTRFVGVLCMLGGGLLILGAAGGGAAFSRLGGLGFLGGGFVTVIIALYLLIGGLYLVAGLKLSNFSSAVTRLIYSGKQQDLEDALDRQRGFWLFAGIMCIFVAVSLALVAVSVFATGLGRDSDSEAVPQLEVQGR